MVLDPGTVSTFHSQKACAIPPGKPPRPPRRSVLNLMQSGYDRAIVWSMAHARLTILACLGAMVMAVVLYQIVPAEIFPEAERNQLIGDCVDAHRRQAGEN